MYVSSKTVFVNLFDLKTLLLLKISEDYIYWYLTVLEIKTKNF